MIKHFLVFAIILLEFTSFTSQSSANLKVHVYNLRNSKGNLLVSLYNEEKPFPKYPKQAFRNMKTTIQDGNANISFQNIPYGRYAIAILHDENGNDKMDQNFIKMPKEGYGFSNNAKGSFGPPGFDAAAFEVNKPDMEISIKASYLFK